MFARSRRMIATMTSLLVLLMTLAACGGVKDTTIPAPPNSTPAQATGDATSPVSLLITSMQPELEKQLAAKNVTTDKQEAYTSTSSLTEVADFYKAQMKERGWKTSAEGEVIDTTNGTAVLAYESGDNGALIMAFDMSSFGEEGVLVMTANAHQK